MRILRGNPWAVLVTTCLAIFMAFLDLSVVTIATPDLSVDLDASLTQVLWVINAGCGSSAGTG